MNMKKIICRMTALLSAVTVFSAQSFTVLAEDEVQPVTQSTASEEQSTDWYKADIDCYGSELSLVEYSEPEFQEYLTDEEKVQSREITVQAFRTANPLSSVVRNPDDENAGNHVGEVPVSYIPPPPDVNPQPGEFAFVTYGWGHGVGLSQNGANFYATYAGWSYQDILYHYYPGTYLMNTGETDTEELTINHVPAGETIDVIAQIVNREIGGTMHYEAIKAQAVAIYTYLKYHDGDSADLLGKPDPPQIVYDACNEVLGQALFYDGNYALTMFSASSGGITANCYEVFYADIPYLRSVSSDFDVAYDPHYGTVTYYPASEVKRLIEAEYNITLSDNPANWIQPVYSEQTGYVTDVMIDGQKSVRGYELKMTLDLKSSKFSVAYSPQTE